MDVRLGPYLLGIDNVSPQTGLAHSAVRDAVNVDFDREGGVRRRRGLGTVLRATSGAGAIYSSRAGIGYVQDGATLYSAVYGGTLTLTQVAALHSADLLSFADLTDAVVYANRTTLGIVKPDGTARALGVESPGALGVTVGTSGGMDAGRYGVAIAYLAGEEEGALGAIVFRDVPAGGGLTLALPTPSEAIVTAINVYQTQVNGDAMALRMRVPVALSSFLLGRTNPGRLAATIGLDRTPPGNIVRYWRGRLLVARGNAVYISEPQRYGLYNPTTGFIQEARRIVLLEPVDGGVFVGTSTGVMFYAGATPKEWSRTVTDSAPPVPFAGAQVPARELGSELGGAAGRYLAMWLTRAGFVIGNADGSLAQPQANRLRLSADSGSLVVSDRQAVAVVT
jgi:hypothetical protein